ncbi:hypothetical protein ASD44_01460 [Mesorhizobium sp. Root554]|nr:hypothetical protein ASD27_01465 [Mesorhizobium sp. Root1471]KQZ35400.1 hypothetical protein ASD44_01460 [Mesorhizobium sp. Root554]
MLPRGGFARNVATLTGATAFGQLTGLLALPILTRICGPQEFGAAAVYSGVVGLIAVIAMLRYEIAITLPRTDRGGLHVAVVALVTLIAISLMASIVSPLMHEWTGNVAGFSNLAFTVLIVAGTLVTGAYQIANYWAIRKSKFSAITQTRIQQGIAAPVFQIGFGLAGFGSLGLILGLIVGQCAGVLRLATNMIADNRKTGFHIHRRGIAWAIRRYSRFPLYDSWAGLLNMAGSQAPVLLFAAFFSPSLAGYYALASRLVSAPNTLVGKALSQALLPKIIAAGRRGEGGPLVLRLISILSWLSFLPFTLVALASGDLIPYAFGAQWAPAASVVTWTAIAAAWQFVVSPLSIVMVGLEALRLHTLVQFILFAARVAAILTGAFLPSADFAIIGFSLASALGYGLFLLVIGAVTGTRSSLMLKAMLMPLILSAACALAALYSAAYISNMAAYGVMFVFGVGWLLCVYKITIKGL